MPFSLPRDPSRPDPSRTAIGRSLASRLLRVIFGCYFVVAVVVTAGQMFTEYWSAHRRLETDIQAMQRTFSRGLADALWSFNAGVMHGILHGIAEMPVVLNVEVRDEHGQVLDSVESTTNRTRDLPIVDQPLERRFDLVYADENGQPHPVGSWIVRSNDGIAVDQVKDTLVVILVNSIVKTLALWGIFSVVVRRMVGRPLGQISDFMMQLDADNLGSRPLRLKARESGELRLLAHVFNTMAAKLRLAFDHNAALMRDLESTNLTLQARVEERTRDLARLARIDQLTGVSNRRDLDERLDGELMRLGDTAKLSVILCDIDHFKDINDQHGHAAGDAVLVAFARLLRCEVRTEDTLGRWGGEEFMILCPGLGIEGGRALAEAMRRRVAETRMPAVGARTCSFGVAELQKGERAETLLIRADRALYAAKRNGRNRVEADTEAAPVEQRSAA